MTQAEANELAFFHASACLDLSFELLEQIRGLKADSAMETLVHIRARHDQMAAMLHVLMPPVIREAKKPTEKELKARQVADRAARKRESL
jgi:hypothetical protein